MSELRFQHDSIQTELSSLPFSARQQTKKRKKQIKPSQSLPIRLDRCRPFLLEDQEDTSFIPVAQFAQKYSPDNLFFGACPEPVKEYVQDPNNEEYQPKSPKRLSEKTARKG